MLTVCCLSFLVAASPSLPGCRTCGMLTTGLEVLVGCHCSNHGGTHTHTVRVEQVVVGCVRALGWQLGCRGSYSSTRNTSSNPSMYTSQSYQHYLYSERVCSCATTCYCYPVIVHGNISIGITHEGCRGPMLPVGGGWWWQRGPRLVMPTETEVRG